MNELSEDGVLRYKVWLCVPDFEGLQKQIIEKIHRSRSSVHLGSTKMYHDLGKLYGGLIWRGTLLNMLLSAQIAYKLRFNTRNHEDCFRIWKLQLGQGRQLIWILLPNYNDHTEGFITYGYCGSTYQVGSFPTSLNNFLGWRLCYVIYQINSLTSWGFDFYYRRQRCIVYS